MKSMQMIMSQTLRVPGPVKGDGNMRIFIKLVRSTQGATAIEYGLIAALIAVAAIGAMQGIGTKLNSTFNNVSTSLV